MARRSAGAFQVRRLAENDRHGHHSRDLAAAQVHGTGGARLSRAGPFGEDLQRRRASASGSQRSSARTYRGVLYVLDEPTIGLHPRDNAQLLDTLEALKRKGNSLSRRRAR